MSKKRKRDSFKIEFEMNLRDFREPQQQQQQNDLDYLIFVLDFSRFDSLI